MKILVLIHEFPPVGGGGGRAAYDICKGLVERKHQITVITSHMKGLRRDEAGEGIRVLRLPSFRTQAYRASFFAMAAYLIVGFWAGYQVIRKNRPDIIHAHFAVPAGALGWMLSRLTHVPYILTAHLGDVPGGVPEKTDKWFRWLLPMTPPIWTSAISVVAVSAYTRELAAKNYPVKIEIIPNGVEPTLFRDEDIEVNIPVRLVFAGRFASQKNPLQIVRILEELKEIDWECAMLGDGPLREEVIHDIVRAGMEDRFFLPGWITPDEVLEQLERSDILLMPSLSEGLPVTGVQALAKGLAVVASKIGGFQEIVEDGKNGYLIPPNEKAVFVQRLGQLITDPDQLRRFRIASLNLAKKFDISRIVSDYENVLEAALNK